MKLIKTLNLAIVTKSAMLEGKLFIIAALGRLNKGQSSLTGWALFVLMSQFRNDNELALQHGRFCTMWLFVAANDLFLGPSFDCLMFITNTLFMVNDLTFYIITKSMHTLWLVNQLWVIVPVNPQKNHASSELLYKSNRPQVFYGL